MDRVKITPKAPWSSFLKRPTIPKDGPQKGPPPCPPLLDCFFLLDLTRVDIAQMKALDEWNKDLYIFFDELLNLFELLPKINVAPQRIRLPNLVHFAMHSGLNRVRYLLRTGATKKLSVLGEHCLSRKFYVNLLLSS